MCGGIKFYGFTYRTILPDGRYYVGQHKIKNHRTLDPNYFGSGVVLKNYIQKHGKDGLKRIILEYAINLEILNFLESQLITEEILNDPLNINLDLGGRNLNTRSKDVCSRIGKSISKIRRSNPEKYPSRQGMMNSKTKHVCWKFISPTAEVFEFTGSLGKFCSIHNLSVITMQRAVKEGWIPRRGICSGWQAFNLTTGQGTNREVQNIGKYRSGENNPMFGKTHSEEYKEKLRIRMTTDNINKRSKA
jgi:hypothetical protein